MHSLSWGIFKMAPAKKIQKAKNGIFHTSTIITDTQTLSLNVVLFGVYTQSQPLC